jgi:HNH endonuclease/Homing endonuclease associated repeat
MTSVPFKLSRVRGIPVTDAQLIDDLKRVAGLTGSETVSQPQYSLHGSFDMRNLSRRLGGWDAALSAAGLSATSYIGEYSDERLFANILVLWQHFGRQPRRAELAFAPSEISQSPYQRRFRSWTGALEAFVEWANAADGPAAPTAAPDGSKRRTSRDPSLRLRFRVLLRDRFTCCGCGKSPATSLGTELHIDHIDPWSKGGETVIENLRTLCLQCNIGRSNVL